MFVVVTFQGAVDVGTGVLRSGIGFDMLAMKLESTGNTLWAKAFPGPQGSEWANALAVDSVGNFAVGGTFERAVDFGGGPVMSAGPISGFVAKFDGFRRHLWSRVFGARQSSAVVEAVVLGTNVRWALLGRSKGGLTLEEGLSQLPANGTVLLHHWVVSSSTSGTLLCLSAHGGVSLGHHGFHSSL